MGEKRLKMEGGLVLGVGRLERGDDVNDCSSHREGSGACDDEPDGEETMMRQPPFSVGCGA